MHAWVCDGTGSSCDLDTAHVLAHSLYLNKREKLEVLAAKKAFFGLLG
jgi:hypothetical protein